MNKIFLDYLDYQTFKQPSYQYQFKEFINIHQKFVADILSFPDATFCVAAPAIAKCKNTAYILFLAKSLWSDNKIKYVLSPAYKGSFSNYVNIRKIKLELNFKESILINDFEYIGYNSDHWSIFFNNFLLTRNLKDSKHDLSRTLDCDTEFRRIVGETFLADNKIDYLVRNGLQNPDRFLSNLTEIISDKKRLFQRELIMNILMQNSNDSFKSYFQFQLDNCFNLANASAVSGLLPQESRGLYNVRLLFFLEAIPYKNTNLKEIIKQMSIESAYELSQQKSWKIFIYTFNQTINELSLFLSYDYQIRNRMQAYFPNFTKWFLKFIATVWIANILSGNVSQIIGSLLTNLPSSVISFGEFLVVSNLSDVTNDVVVLIKKHYELSLINNEYLYKAIFSASENYFEQN